MSEKLKPCPWCGVEPKGHSVRICEEFIDIHIECGTRGCSGNREVFDDSRSAIEAWNRRHQEQEESSSEFERLMK